MKEYLLLRNNKQSGPYTLEELNGMGLKPFDLIWHQKKSASWKYPSEIDELGAFVADTLTTTTSSAQHIEALMYTPEKSSSFAGSSNKEFQAQNSAVVEEEEAPVRYIRHVVALKPTIDHTQVKTIKSASHPNIVKVEVRDNETIIERAEHKESNAALYERSNDTTFADYSNNTVPEEIIVTNNLVKNNAAKALLYTEPDNKLEWMMLIIGATSLIAIVYLLITSPY